MQLPLGNPASVPPRPFAIPLHDSQKSAWMLRKLVSEINRLLRLPLRRGSVSDEATNRDLTVSPASDTSAQPSWLGVGRQREAPGIIKVGSHTLELRM